MIKTQLIMKTRKLFGIFCVLSLFLLPFNLKAQKNDVRLNFGFQKNIPERFFNKDIPKHNGKNDGFGVHLYPKWYYSDNISFGLNMEYCSVEEDYQTDAIHHFSILSFSPTANYYFTNSTLRPFVGMGIGLYHVLDHTPAINIGLRPIVGLSVSRIFDLSLEYNQILAGIDVDPKVHGDFDNYYLSIKGSFSIGILNTGKKNKP